MKTVLYPKACQSILMIVTGIWICVTPAKSQVGFGPKFNTRFANDIVGFTYGFGIAGVFLNNDSVSKGFFSGLGVEMSIPKNFDGTANILPIDAAVHSPFDVPVSRKVTDAAFYLDFGKAFRCRNSSVWIASAGFRFQLRIIDWNFHQPWDPNTHYSNYSEADPNIPMAFRLGFNVKFGYLYRCNWFAIYPCASVGFGTNGQLLTDNPNNSYPPYFDFSITLMKVKEKQ